MGKPVLSILGSGWLGLPLAVHLRARGYVVKVSTTRSARIDELAEVGLDPHVVNIDDLDDSVGGFLQSDILICNITSKSLRGFAELIAYIERSPVSNVLFVSSTSVYPNVNKTVTESDRLESPTHPLVNIENLFNDSKQFDTTILRFGGLIGYRRNPANFFRPGRPMRDPEAYVNLIHRDDCIHIIDRIIEQGAWGEVFNACADSHPRKLDFYTRVCAQVDRSAPELANDLANGFKIVSNEKLKKRLDYRFIYADLMSIDYGQST